MLAILAISASNFPRRGLGGAAVAPILLGASEVVPITGDRFGRIPTQALIYAGERARREFLQ
jgi:hypothetical protein